MQFLMGFNDSYFQIKRQILLMDPLPSVNKVYSLLIQEERQRSVEHSNFVHKESTTLAVKGSNPNFNSNFPRFLAILVFLEERIPKGKTHPFVLSVGSLDMSRRNASSYMVFLQASNLKARTLW